jgi:hypothetical protein
MKLDGIKLCMYHIPHRGVYVDKMLTEGNMSVLYWLSHVKYKRLDRTANDNIFRSKDRVIVQTPGTHSSKRVFNSFDTTRWFSLRSRFTLKRRNDAIFLYSMVWICLKVWVSDCCLTPTQQLFRQIMARTS